MKCVISAALLCCLSVMYAIRTVAQSVPCPPNIDFESGNFSYWQLYSGACCPINTPSSGVITGRHTITSGAANDPYGGFPVVSPGGNYSLKLGNNSVGAQAERARYFVHVPAGINDYSLIFRYAVVFQDPSHAVANQPRFEVKAFDSITNTIVNCSQFIYVATSNLPGFSLSSVGSSVWYKSWTTASIDLSGYAGRTVVIDFASGDCALGAHFGYGYIDLDCGLFKINTVACASSATTTLTAPPGFQSYVWKDSTLTTTLATGQTATITTPSATTKYAVILTPYTGYGCPDTLYTTVTVSNINLNASDTTICIGSTAQLHANATGTGTPYAYLWSPSTTLSCTNCANPVTNTTINRTFYVTVTNIDGCSKLDTVNVSVSNISLSNTKQNISCYGLSNGSLSVAATGGISPYTYLWNTSPSQTTATATGLNTGIYSVTVTDNKGCTKLFSDTITQPFPLLITKSINIPASCFGYTNGSASILASGGTSPYTYSWNTIPAKTTASISGLGAGIYTVVVTDTKGCTNSDTVQITQPPILTSTTTKTDVSCYNGINGSSNVTTTGGTPPYAYLWNTNPVKTVPNPTNLNAGTYIVTTTDLKGCSDTDTVIITQPTPLTLADSQTNVKCFGGNTGNATVLASGGVMPYTYNWNTNPARTTQSINNITAGTYIATITDNNNCIAKDTISITQPAPLSTTKSKNDVSCHGGNNGTASVNTTGGTAPYRYNWNSVPPQTSSNANTLPAGVYTVTITDTNNCVLQDTVIISHPTALTTTTSKTDVSCYGGNNGTGNVSAAGGTSPYTYSWNTNPVQTTANATSLSATKYIITVTDNNGCIKRDSIDIIQPTRLSTGITKGDLKCYSDSSGFISAIISGGSYPYSCNWNTIPLRTTATINKLNPGTYTLVVTDSNGCKDTTITTITQPAKLTASLSRVDVKCYGGNDGEANVIAAGGTIPYSYKWTNTVTSSKNPKLKAGGYNVNITDANGCEIHDSIVIKEPSLLTITAVETSKTCAGFNNGSASSSTSGGTPPYSYLWNSTTLQTTSNASGLSNGSYIVTVTDANGCQSDDTVDVHNYPKPDISIGPDTTICFGNSAILYTNGAAFNTWSPTYGLSCINCAVTVASPRTTTLYTVVGVDSNKCADTASVNITVIPKNEVTVGPPIDVCEGQQATLSASGGIRYSWTPPALLDNSLIANPTTIIDSNMAYTVVITENDCFSDTLQQIVRVHPIPTVELGPDLKGTPGSTIQLYADVTVAKNIAWKPETGLNCYDCFNPLASLQKTITYTATVTTGFCEASDNITIRVACDDALFFMPNTFTPNGDGSNDKFYPIATGVSKIDLFRVYNRWGEKIHEARNFEPNKPEYGWDGKFHGEPQWPDVFVYFIETRCSNGEKVLLKGDISLIR